MFYKIILEISNGAVVVGLNVNFDKAFDTTSHGCVKLKLM